MRKRLLVSLAAVGVSLALAAPAGAAIVVANQNDSGPGSLREAIATSSPGEEVSVPAGTYTLSSGPLLIERSVRIVGAATATTVIRGNGGAGDLQIIGPGDVELSDLTIREGRINGTGAGAGIFSVNADLDLEQVAVIDNSIDADGASGSPGGTGTGAGLYFSGPSLEISRSTISENSVSADGGAGKVGGSAAGTGLFAVDNTGRIRISDTTIAGNTTEVRGGQGPSSSEQAGGSSAGGGAYVIANTPSATRVAGVTISGNTTDVSGGPGANNGSATAGGLYLVNNGAPGIYENLTIAGNRLRGDASGGSGSGGGAYIVAGQPLYLYNATIASNGIEGGLAASSVAGNVFLVNSVSAKDSIIAGGFGPPIGANCYVAGGVTSLGYNIDSTEQCGFATPTDKRNTDPQLGPLQNNGGPILTLLPAGSSPAVDQGDSVGPVDARGVVRPIDFPSIANAPGGDGSDIGAVELQPVSSVSLSKPKLNKRKGTAIVTVTVPAPSAGSLTLTGKGLQPQSASLTGQGTVAMSLVAKGGIAKALRKKGTAKVAYEVLYSPTGNAAAAESASVKLVKKHQKKKKKKHAH